MLPKVLYSEDIHEADSYLFKGLFERYNLVLVAGDTGLWVKYILTALNHKNNFKGPQRPTLERKTRTPSWKNVLRNLGRDHYRGNPLPGIVEK